MKVRKPVWSEGLFITEHHLQQQDAYHEYFVDERFAALPQPHWGILELKVDTDALAQGHFVLNRLRGIMPDGTPFNCGAGEGALPATREVGSHFAANLGSLPVYLALPLASHVRGNLGVEGTSTGRLKLESESVADFNGGGRHQNLSWGRPDLRILFGSESREGMCTIQIADLLRSQAGAYLPRDTFIPPAMRLGASEFLQVSLRRVSSAMTTRARDVAATRRRRTEAHVEIDAGDVSKMLLLTTLNRNIPLFAHLVESPETHPETAYLAVVQLAGELSTFVSHSDPTTLPRYDYLALGDTFEPAIARALNLINTTIKERYVQIPLKRRDDGMYLGRIEDKALLQHDLFLGVHGTLSDAEIHHQLPKLSKSASWGAIGNLLNQAVNGARVELEYRPSAALPVQPGVSFFKIQRTPEYWPDIAATSTIAIYHPLPIEAMELALYAVDPEKL